MNFAQLLAFKRENCVYRWTKNSHFSMSKGLRMVRDLCLPAKGRKQSQEKSAKLRVLRVGQNKNCVGQNKNRFSRLTQEKMPFKCAWKLSVARSSKRGRSNYLPRIWTDYLHNLKVAQNGCMEEWCFFFFRRWSRNLEMDTWRSGCFWFYCIQNFRA